jgi:hypothetical protein
VTLVGRNAAQFFFCFAGSALLNVLSQRFFVRVAGDDRDAWLSGTLLLGTAASLLGVPAAQRLGLPGRAAVSGQALVLAGAGLFALTFGLDSAVAFAAVSTVLRFLLQYGTQEFDRRAVWLAGDRSRKTNDGVGLAMRFGGMLAGPLWFSLVTHTAVSLVLIAAMAALASWTVVSTASAPPADRSAPGQLALTTADRLVLWAARCIYAAYYLLASSIVSVLFDLHHVSGAVERGGLVVTMVYASAIGTTVLALLRKRQGPRPVLDMLPAPLAMMAVGVALPLPAVGQWPLELAGALGLGIAFARYQLAFRDRATAEALAGRPALVAAYNNLGTTSALLGYAVMSTLVALSRQAGEAYASWAGRGTLLLGGAGALLVLAAKAQRRAPGNAT